MAVRAGVLFAEDDPAADAMGRGYMTDQTVDLASGSKRGYLKGALEDFVIYNPNIHETHAHNLTL